MDIDIEEGIHGTGRFLRMLADEAHPVDRHCACGRIILTPALACEVCEPEQLPSLLRAQAA
jgi:hypothetical protein